MNIKSLLIGSAALATVSTGAQAADAIVMADPEPMEYVRICDVYGAGFFYIPGTETCLKIGGYMRYEIRGAATGITKQARIDLKFDARSDTEIGTLRGYSEFQLDWQNGTRPGVTGNPAVVTPVTGYGADVTVDHVYIQLIRGSHSWRFGRTHSPFSSFLGYALFGTNDLGVAFNRTQEISYTFTGSNGFSFVAAVLDDQDANFIPDLELGFKFERGWGHIGLVAGGDFDGGGAQGGNRVKGSLLVRFGNSGVSWKTQATFLTASANAGISAVTGFNFQFTPKFGMYIQGGVIAGTGVVATLGANITPVTNFLVRPEVFLAGAAFGANIRIERAF